MLVMFSCAVRTKEMGIRKVLGASRWNLFYQLGKGFFTSYYYRYSDCVACGMGQHECMVGSLSVPNRIESVVLSASCGLDVVDFFSDCSRTNHKGCL